MHFFSFSKFFFIKYPSDFSLVHQIINFNEAFQMQAVDCERKTKYDWPYWHVGYCNRLFC